MKILKTLGFGVALAAMAVASGAASAQSQSSGRKAQTKSMQEIPVCQKRLGTVSIVEPDTNWWQQLGLGSPEAIIKLFVMKSGCFGLVDRGKGLASRNIERALADSGELQANSNIGKRQVKAADYFIVPDLVSKNENSGGGGLGAIAGGLLGSRTLGVGGRRRRRLVGRLRRCRRRRLFEHRDRPGHHARLSRCLQAARDAARRSAGRPKRCGPGRAVSLTLFRARAALHDAALVSLLVILLASGLYAGRLSIGGPTIDVEIKL